MSQCYELSVAVHIQFTLLYFVKIESSSTISNATYCLLLPGPILNLSTLLVTKKFRARGNKEGALTAMKMLQDDKLGRLIELSSTVEHPM